MDPGPFSPDASYLLLAAFVALAYTAEAATGFGSILIALTLGAQLYAVPELLPLLLPLSVLLTAFVVARQRAYVDLQLLSRRILPWMAPGAALGFVLAAKAPSAWLAPALGVFVIGVAGLELLRGGAGRAAPMRPLGAKRFAGASFGAGVVQGMAGSGGPVLVYALGREGLCKARFRATLALVWLVLNVGLVASFCATGRLGASTLPYVAGLVPVLVLAFVVGDWLHHRVDEERFKRGVLVMLVAAGVALLL